MTSFIVPGIPVPQGSMRAVVRGKRAVIFSANPSLHAWRDAVSYVARHAHVGAPYAGACAVRVAFTMPRPASVRKRPYPSVKPDLDKLIRAILDACTDAGVWADDGQVIAIAAVKRYGEPGVSVRIREL